MPRASRHLGADGTSQRVQREMHRSFSCDVTLHAKAVILSPQPGHLYLLGRDLVVLVTTACTVQYPLANSQSYTVA